jgi:hypothetical protein
MWGQSKDVEKGGSSHGDGVGNVVEHEGKGRSRGKREQTQCLYLHQLGINLFSGCCRGLLCLTPPKPSAPPRT